MFRPVEGDEMVVVLELPLVSHVVWNHVKHHPNVSPAKEINEF